jgi:Domain of unknown function (DUF4258)
VFEALHNVTPQCFRDGDYQETPHAAIRRYERGIRLEHVEIAIGFGGPEVIEDYPGDPRGHSCLFRGEVHGHVLHALCTLTVPVLIISCYWPDPAQWDAGLRNRRQ